MAVGFADGSVILLRHLDQTISSTLAAASAASNPPQSLPKHRIVHSGNNEPITGLHFLNSKLIVATPSKIVSFSKNGKSAPSTIADTGANLNCTVITSTGKLVVGRDEALFVYGPDGREGTWAYEGPKLALYTAHNYLVIVSPPFAPTAASAYPTVRQYASRSRDRDFKGDIARLSLFDVDHKFIGKFIVLLPVRR